MSDGQQTSARDLVMFEAGQADERARVVQWLRSKHARAVVAARVWTRGPGESPCDVLAETLELIEWPAADDALPSKPRPRWFADPAYLKKQLERIATHPECAPRIYNIAADALCWARTHVQCEAREGDGVTGAQCELEDGHLGGHAVPSRWKEKR